MELTYAGITFPPAYTATQGVDQTPILDPTGTDQVATRVVVRVQSVLAPTVVPALGGETPAATAARIRASLMKVRQPLTVSHNGVVLVSVPAPPDEQNGPKPLACTVTPAGEGSYVVTFAVEAAVKACPDAGAGVRYKSLRYGQSTGYDERWSCTKRTSGALVVSSADGVNPDDLRGLVTPGIDQGFRRQSADYQVDETGLVYRFSFVDKQLDTPPPFPATKMRLRQVEHAPNPGKVRYGRVTVHLDGPPGVPPRDLLTAAVRVAVNRALAAGMTAPVGAQAGADVPIGYTATQVADDDQNAVELNLDWMMRAGPERTSGADALVRQWGGAVKAALRAGLGPLGELGNPGAVAPPPPTQQGRDTAAVSLFGGWVGAPVAGSDPARSIAPPTRGTASRVRAVAAALGDPCGEQVPDPPAGATTNELTARTADGADVTVTELQSAYAPSDLAGLYEDDTPGVYESYEVTTHHLYGGGNAILPSTKAGDPAAEVRLFNETLGLRVEWTAKRAGGPPVLPDPNPADANVVRTGRTVSLPQVEVAADGVSFIHTVSGVYEFGVLDPDKYDVAAPIPPYLQFRAAAQAPDPTELVSGRILWGGTGSGGTSELRGGPVGP